MRHTIDDILIDITIEENGVRAISGENNMILPNQDPENVMIIIDNNYRFLRDYYIEIANGKIEPIDIKLICIKIVFHYLYMYNMWRKLYEKEKNRDLKFDREDLHHPQTNDIIFDYFKCKYPKNWMNQCAIMMDMSLEDCKKKFDARELFKNR